MKIYTIPNIITFIRIGLIPFFIYYFLSQQYRIGIIIFIIAGFSDVFDGSIARRFKQSSPLGAFIDPAADKLLMLASFLCLSLTGWIPIWVAVAVIARDLQIVFGFWYLKAHKAVVTMGAIPISKLNTFLQLLTASLAFLRALQSQEKIPYFIPYENALDLSFQIVMWSMLVTLLLSSLEYTKVGLKCWQPALKKI